MEKLYRKRRFDEAIEEARVPDFDDPYKGSRDALIFDLVMVLNYMETICVEVKLRNANAETLLQAVGVTIVGARAVLLTRLDDLLEEDQTAAYATLVEVAADFKAKLEKLGSQMQIPDPKSENDS